MLPLTIQKRLASPGKLENEFLNFLRKANAPIDQSKTIAYQVLTDSKLTGGQNNVEFFTGDFVQNRTNIDGSYIRPSSEHFLIYGIRGYYNDDVPPLDLTNFKSSISAVPSNLAINEFSSEIFPATPPT